MSNNLQNAILKILTRITRYFIIFLVLLLLGTGLTHFVFTLLRPPRTFAEKQLADGIIYQRTPKQKPRPFVIHQIKIDLPKNNLKSWVTPGTLNPEGVWQFAAQTTSTFLQKSQVNLAINGSYFQPFYTHHPFDFYPKTGDFVSVNGESISQGKTYSQPLPGWSVLCFDSEDKPSIESDRCPPDTVQGIAGGYMLVNEGKSRQFYHNEKTDLAPRSAVGLDAAGETLWLVVVDGRQPWYSEGVTLPELTDYLIELGCDRALILDGGGSTTLVIEENGQPKTLNSPIHTRIPLRQRPIANHLGFKYRSINN